MASPQSDHLGQVVCEKLGLDKRTVLAGSVSIEMTELDVGSKVRWEGRAIFTATETAEIFEEAARRLRAQVAERESVVAR